MKEKVDMFSIAVKVIRNNKARALFTIVGIAIAVFILLLGMYYWEISNYIIEDNLNNVLSERMILVNKVEIPLVDYYELGDEMIPNYVDVGDTDILSIISFDGVASVQIKYLAPVKMLISFNDNHFESKESYAVNSNYDIFPGALIDRLKEDDSAFEEIVAGEVFSGSNPYEVMLNEFLVISLGLVPEDVIGEKITLSIPGTNDINLSVVGVYSSRLSSWISEDMTKMQGWLTDSYSNETTEMEDVFLFNHLLFHELAKTTDRKEFKTPSSIVCSMKDTSYIADFGSELSTHYSRHVQSDYLDYFDQLEKQSEFKEVFMIVGAILVLLVLIMVANSISINLYQQKRFIRLLSLLGYRRCAICRLYAIQSSMYGFAGAMIGSILGYTVTTFLGLRTYISLKEYGIKSSSLLLPVKYIISVVFVFLMISLVLGFFIAALKTRRKD